MVRTTYCVLTGFYTSWDPLFLLFSQFWAPTNGDLSTLSAQSCTFRRLGPRELPNSETGGYSHIREGEREC